MYGLELTMMLNLGPWTLLPIIFIGAYISVFPPFICCSESPAGKNEWFSRPRLLPHPFCKLPLLSRCPAFMEDAQDFIGRS